MTVTAAYLRDASWYANPSTSGPKKLHRESSEFPGTPACNPNRVLLVMEAPYDTAKHEASLCRRCFPKPSNQPNP